MASENTQGRVTWPVAYGLHPKSGSRAMPQTLDFGVESPVNIDLAYDEAAEKLEFVQCLYVDNSLNPSPLTVILKTTNQSVVFPAGWQGYLPVLASKDNTKIQFITATLNALIPVQYLTFPLPAQMWPASGSAGGGSLGVDFSANKPVLLGNLIATIPVNAMRAFFEAQNQDSNDMQIVMDDGAGANVSICIMAAASVAGAQGGGYTNAAHKGRVRIYSSISAPQLYLRQW